MFSRYLNRSIIVPFLRRSLTNQTGNFSRQKTRPKWNYSRLTSTLFRRTTTTNVALSGGILFVLHAATKTNEKVNYDEVRKSIASLLDDQDYDDGSFGPLFVRLGWHASGTYSKIDSTGGSNGGCIRFEPEAAWGANSGLYIARQRLQKIYLKYPGLTYADLYTLAAVVAIEEMGGPKIKWRPGRTDDTNGKRSPPDGRLPDAAQGAQHIRDIFYRMGFNDKEIVALCGAHSLGRCHTDRSGFEGPWTNAPTTFSNEYFRLLLEEKWQERKWNGPKQYEDVQTKTLMMLPSDMALIEDPEFRKHVIHYAKDGEQFSKDFAEAFGKLLELGVTFKSTNTENKSFWQRIFG